MADPVKITDLPEITTLTSQDIIPVVDSSETQTSRATLEQVRNLGPGDGTVGEDALKPGAVTPTKTGFDDPDMTFYATTLANGDGKYIGAQTALTAYARTLLAAPDATQAWQILSANPNYSGQITVPPLTPTTPSYSFTDDTSTGMFSGPDGFINFSALGDPVLSIGVDRTIYTLQPQATEQQMTPFIGFNAMLIFQPGASAQTITINGAEQIGHFFGFPRFVNKLGHWDGPSMARDATTIAGIDIRLDNLGWDIFDQTEGIGWARNWSGDTRTNYTSPGDNCHVRLDSNGNLLGTPSASTPIPAASQYTAGEIGWIGRLTFGRTATADIIVRRHNVAAIQQISSAFTNSAGNSVTARSGQGRYKITFSIPFPDTDYMVLGGAYRAGPASTQLCVVDKRVDYAIVDYTYATSTYDSGGVNEFFFAAMR